MLGPGRTPNHPLASGRTPHDGPRALHPPSPLRPGRPPSPRPSWCWNPATKPAQQLAERQPAAPPLRPHEPLPPSTSTPRGDSKGVRFKGGGAQPGVCSQQPLPPPEAVPPLGELLRRVLVEIPIQHRRRAVEAIPLRGLAATPRPSSDTRSGTRCARSK